MILQDCFCEEYIREKQKTSGRDPVLLERVIYAFGLLEALKKVNLPFIFKGGSCLMLLLEKPRRLSTDIDIIVAPGTDIEKYIAEASSIFPFLSQEEDVRVKRNNIEKRHFKFAYNSPVNKRPFYILLDVLFEENNYVRTESKPINHDLLLCDNNPLFVEVPSIDCILGDKLTAFAPHTTGIPLYEGRDLEVIKQMYDISSLINEFTDFQAVQKTYQAICQSEISYRGIDITPNDALLDSFMVATTIASRGKAGNRGDYSALLSGMRKIYDHIYYENFNAQVASGRAPQIMYMCMCLMTNTPYEKIEDYLLWSDKKILSNSLESLKDLRKAFPLGYAYVIKADELFSKL